MDATELTAEEREKAKAEMLRRLAESAKRVAKTRMQLEMWQNTARLLDEISETRKAARAAELIAERRTC